MKIVLEGINIRRGGILIHADGEFSEGVHLLTGLVGSGKSTLGEVITGVIVPDEGAVRKEGIRSSVLSMQFPEYHITTTTAAEEILSWGLDPLPVLKRAGLEGRGEDDMLRLSRGELKRLHLSCLLAGSHDLMVLDEPFAGLDEEARLWVASHLERLSDRIVIIISHDLTTLPVIDQLWEMDGGTLSYHGAIPGALGRWNHAPPLVRYLLDQGAEPSGLSWKELAEAVCRIRE
jgi:energy-coupling factor transport system ATP-binding protein